MVYKKNLRNPFSKLLAIAAACLAFGASAQTSLDTAGLVAWYDMDGPEDSSGNGYGLDPYGAPAYQDGYGMSDNATASCWKQALANSGFADSLGSDHSCVIRFRRRGSENYGSSSYAVSFGNWKNMVRTNGTVRINGVFTPSLGSFDDGEWKTLYFEFDSQALLGRASLDNGAFQIADGSFSQSASSFILGGAKTSEIQDLDIDYMGLFNRKLSAVEVAQIYNEGETTTLAALTGAEPAPAPESDILVGDKIENPNPEAGANFGNGLAIDRESDRIIVRARSQAYVYERSGAAWSPMPMESVAGEALQLDLGDASNTVGIYGDWAVVGNPYFDEPGFDDVGAVYVFKRNGSQWDLHGAPILSPMPTVSGKFGHSVSILGRQLIVGALHADDASPGLGEGRAYVYELIHDSWGLSPIQTLSHDHLLQTATTSSIVSDNLGRSVSIFEDNAVVSEGERDGGVNPEDEQVQLYSKRANAFGQVHSLLDPEAQAPSSRFGWSVSLSGDYLAIGAPLSDQEGHAGAGAVFVYKRESGSWSASPVSKIVAPTPGVGLRFGHSVDLFGDTLVVGRDPDGSSSEEHAVYIYHLKASTGDWELQRSLVSSSSGMRFGSRIAVGPGYVILSQTDDSVGGHANAGSVYAHAFESEGVPSPPQLPSANIPPVAAPDTISLSEDDASRSVADSGASSLLDNDSDPDATGTLNAIVQSESGTYGDLAVSDDGSFAYTLTQDLGHMLPSDPDATDSFDYHISDGLDTGESTVDVSIVGVNDAPVLVTEVPDQNAAPGFPFDFTIPENSFADVDQNDLLSWTITKPATGADWITSIDNVTRRIQGFPTTSDSGSYTIAVNVSDLALESATDAFEILVTVPYPPPGTPLTPADDTDGDLLPDAWEALYGIDSSSDTGADGAEGNLDGDAFSNRLEYLFGTHPLQADVADDQTISLTIFQPLGQ